MVITFMSLHLHLTHCLTFWTHTGWTTTLDTFAHAYKYTLDCLQVWGFPDKALPNLSWVRTTCRLLLHWGLCANVLALDSCTVLCLWQPHPIRRYSPVLCLWHSCPILCLCSGIPQLPSFLLPLQAFLFCLCLDGIPFVFCASDFAFLTNFCARGLMIKICVWCLNLVWCLYVLFCICVETNFGYFEEFWSLMAFVQSNLEVDCHWFTALT